MADKYTEMFDETKSVPASEKRKEAGAGLWAERIVEFLLSRETATVREILENTDPKFDGKNFGRRKHCLKSQFTKKIRQDLLFDLCQVGSGKETYAIRGRFVGDRYIPRKPANKTPASK